MPNKKTQNSLPITHYSEADKQELYKTARAKNWYDDIWKTVGKCVFCDLNEKYILFEENGVVMTISLYGYIDGHFMIIPRRHVQSPKELSTLEWETYRKFMYIAKKMIKKTYGVDSMQVVYKDGINAQSTVGHIHFHCIPFDNPDLCKWNYKELQFTPLENVSKYKSKRIDFFKYKKKFEKEYSNQTSLPVVCDLIVKNKEGKFLFQERKDEYKFVPDVLTLPGGHCDDLNKSLEENLSKEIKEEANLKIDLKKLKLVSSGIGEVNQKENSKHMKVNYLHTHKFIWNTYAYEDVVDGKKLKAGDDCKEIVWLSLDQVKKHKRISAEVKERIDKL